MLIMAAWIALQHKTEVCCNPWNIPIRRYAEFKNMRSKQSSHPRNPKKTCGFTLHILGIHRHDKQAVECQFQTNLCQKYYTVERTCHTY
jgi:hypothetical protein